MRTLRIRGFTRYLGKPSDWRPDDQGPCNHLAIRDEMTTAGHGMTSAWEPLPEEIERIKAGAPILLTVLGAVHPPVAMSVGAALDDNPTTPDGGR